MVGHNVKEVLNRRFLFNPLSNVEVLSRGLWRSLVFQGKSAVTARETDHYDRVVVFPMAMRSKITRLSNLGFRRPVDQ